MSAGSPAYSTPEQIAQAHAQYEADTQEMAARRNALDRATADFCRATEQRANSRIAYFTLLAHAEPI